MLSEGCPLLHNLRWDFLIGTASDEFLANSSQSHPSSAWDGMPDGLIGISLVWRIANQHFPRVTYRSAYLGLDRKARISSLKSSLLPTSNCWEKCQTIEWQPAFEGRLSFDILVFGKLPSRLTRLAPHIVCHITPFWCLATMNSISPTSSCMPYFTLVLKGILEFLWYIVLHR